MKSSNQSTLFAGRSTIALLAGVCSILPVALHAAEASEAPQKPVVAEHLFASPDDAVKALQTAAAAKDKSALCEIFGPEFRELLTGDAVQDANNAQGFATAVAQNCNPVKAGENQDHV